MKWLADSLRWLGSRFKKLWPFGQRSPPPRRRVQIIEGDTPPDIIEGDDLVLAREDGEDWAIAFLCPCGCKDRLELALIPEVKPHWTLELDREKHPTLHPSVWRKTGCHAHFWVRNGLIFWCK